MLAMGAWGRVAWLAAQPGYRLIVAVSPYVRHRSAQLAAAAAAQPKKAIAVEAVSLILLIGLWRLMRFIKRRR